MCVWGRGVGGGSLRVCSRGSWLWGVNYLVVFLNMFSFVRLGEVFGCVFETCVWGWSGIAWV